MGHPSFLLDFDLLWRAHDAYSMRYDSVERNEVWRELVRWGAIDATRNLSAEQDWEQDWVRNLLLPEKERLTPPQGRSGADPNEW